MATQVNSIKTFRKELTPILLKLFQKIVDKETLPNSFYEATITLIPKQTQEEIENLNRHITSKKI